MRVRPRLVAAMMVLFAAPAALAEDQSPPSVAPDPNETITITVGQLNRFVDAEVAKAIALYQLQLGQSRVEEAKKAARPVELEIYGLTSAGKRAASSP